MVFAYDAIKLRGEKKKLQYKLSDIETKINNELRCLSEIESIKKLKGILDEGEGMIRRERMGRETQLEQNRKEGGRKFQNVNVGFDVAALLRVEDPEDFSNFILNPSNAVTWFTNLPSS